MVFLTHWNKVSCVDDTGKEIGKVTFPEREKGHFEINHTFVDENHQGQGIAGKLLRYAINEINVRGGEVTATCSYAKKYIEKNGLRPMVVCHMMTSADGKVTGDFLSTDTGLAVSKEYYRIHREMQGDAFACGRVTMETSFTNGSRPDLTAFENEDVPYEDHVAMKHSKYAVSFDRYGNIGWTDSKIHDEDEGYDDCHIIEVLSESAPQSYLAYLRSIGVSYIFAGDKDTDIKIALNKLYSLFGIKKLVLEGGSIINGAFARAGVIDYLSLVVSPVVANADDKPLFTESRMTEYKLMNVSKLKYNAVLLEYSWK